MKLLINGISLPYTAAEGDFIAEAKKRLGRVTDASAFDLKIFKKAVDARRRGDIRFVCSVLAEGEDGLISPDAAARAGFGRIEEADLHFLPGSEQLYGNPLVVGSGPAGMFCALTLAESGYSPILIERGGNTAERVAAYERFCTDGELDVETNIQYGAGGAGTFSDGKLTTRINDPLCGFVLRKFYEAGAPESILTRAKPHVGTDVLRNVVDRILEMIRENGGSVILGCRLDSLEEKADGSLVAHTSKGDIACGCCVLATGHSANDTRTSLMKSGFVFEPKPFSVGVRIEHLRTDIDRALYGDLAGDPRLGAAEYNLSDTSGRGVYTFCMCPGGEIVAAATEKDGLVVNGMSFSRRDGVNSNSAIAVSVGREDFGNTVEGAVGFIRNIEKAAFTAGGGDFCAPVETVGDFLSGKAIHSPTRIMPTYMGGGKYRVTELSAIFPDFITEEIKLGLHSFGRRIKGFDSPDAILTGAETRTSSPVRMPRDKESLTALGHSLVYPCGEGAGYAGGITSAAVDGVKAASKIIERFAPSKN